MMHRQLSEVSNKEDLDNFYTVAGNIRSRNNRFELPWLESRDIEQFIDENDLSHQLIVVSNDNSEGRVLAYQFSDSKDSGYLGWYECDDDDDLSKSLINTGIEWLVSQGVSDISGPMNGSSWGAFRFNTLSDKPLFITEPYQPLYYVKQWENLGFEHEVIYETHLVPKEISRPMSLWKVKLMAFLIGVRFNKWPKTLIENENKLRDMHAFFHECFKDNQLYRPITFERYKEITIKLETILDFDHSYLVTDQKGKPVSVLVSYRDVYHQMYLDGKLKDEVHNTHTLYMKTIATAKAWRGKHISRVLVNFGFVQAYKNGYNEVVFGTMMSENKSAQYSKSFFKAKALRTYSFMKLSV